MNVFRLIAQCIAMIRNEEIPVIGVWRNLRASDWCGNILFIQWCDRWGYISYDIIRLRRNKTLTFGDGTVPPHDLKIMRVADICDEKVRLWPGPTKRMRSMRIANDQGNGTKSDVFVDGFGGLWVQYYQHLGEVEELKEAIKP